MTTVVRLHPLPPLRPDRSPLFDLLTASLEAARSIKPVYPFYLACRIKRALREADPEGIVAAVGDIQTIGDCRYATTVTDTSGTKYRITVEVVS